MGPIFESNCTNLHKVARCHTDSSEKVLMDFAKVLKCEHEVFYFKVELFMWVPHIDQILLIYTKLHTTIIGYCRKF